MKNRFLRLGWEAWILGILAVFISHEILTNKSKDPLTIPISNWALCSGAVQIFNENVCEKTEKAKPISPRNAPEEGTMFTYLASYEIKRQIPNQNYALNLGPIGDEEKVWVDGKFIGESFYGDGVAVAFHDWKMHPLSEEMLSPGLHNLVLQVKYVGPMLGGVLGKPSVTTNKYAQIKKLRYNFYRTYLPFAFSIALVVLALYSGLVGAFGQNKSFFYDYMSFGIFFSMYIGSISFVYSYVGFDWIDTMIFYGIDILGSIYFSSRLYFQFISNERVEIYRTRFNYFFMFLVGTSLLLFVSKNYVAYLMLVQFLIVTFTLIFCFFHTKYGYRILRERVSFYSITAFLVGPLFLVATGIDVYKEFQNAGSIFYSSYALIALGFFVMLFFAKQHVEALKDQQMKNELEIKNENLKYLSERDPLTSLYNRRTFESLIEYNINDANEKRGYALLILDIDHFKAYNDSYGHPSGDRLLVQFSEVLKDTVRMSDYVGRLGGEEFGVFLHNVTFDQAKTICENIRSSVETANFENLQKTGKHVTVSIGAIHFDRSIEKIKYVDSYKAADKCLYQAKETRNTVILKDYKSII